MKNSKLKNGGFTGRALRAFLIFHSTFLIGLRASENFGDVSVEPHAMFTGNTFHGYSELRVALENHSHTKPHTVTLACPNSSYNNGNRISSLMRTVKLQPDAREIISLLQPPLPAQGDGQIRITVDGRHEGEMRMPNANNHCNLGYSYGRNNYSPTLLVSRGLDFDGVGKVFNSGRGAFTAEMATGAPDARGRGYQANSWMPDTRLAGAGNWLELDYDSPQIINRILIYNSMSSLSSGTVTLVGVSGTNLAALSMASGKNKSRGAGWMNEFSFPETTEPVKSVKLDFATAPPYNLAIDAVEIAGTNGSQWATAARASSDNSASAKTYAPSGAENVIASLRAESPVAEWSENWLAYTPFDAILLSPADVNLLTPGVTGALTDYLHAGGNIFIAGGGKLPAAWRVTHKENLPDGSLSEIGFGHAFASGHFLTMNPASVKKIRDLVHGTARYWQNLPADSGAANAVLPVVENLKIPTRGIVVVMLAFIIVIGPVNIFYLSRRHRRTWMLWTIPAISLVTTLIVFAYSLLREGITPDTRIAGLTFLDQSTHRAATIGAEGFYCPLTPSGGLTFGSATEATPLVTTGYGAGSPREVDWSASQHFTRGWISSRVPAHFHVRKSEPRRERIQVVNENGKLVAINSLGANIKTLWYADTDMKIYEANNVAAGEKGVLILSPQSRAVKISGEESLHSGVKNLLTDINYSADPHSLYYSIEKYILPGTYIAVLEGNPFLENALGTASVPKRTKSSAVVFGILEATETK